MSDYIPPSLIDSESDGPHSPALSSSFGSMNDTSLPTDKMEQLIRKLRSENKALQLRVLGVNELARLLQDRREKVKVLEDKNKRLEVAVVRLENRCANLEQKLRAEGGGATVGPKSMQPPSIPGPSRQILEALMKENSELKKALNNMQKKGQSGYLEAVKTTQLEEVIEQQKQELDFLRGQVNTLTTTPLPPASAHHAEEESGDSALRSTSQSTAGSTGSLRRQLIKMQHSLKVKDRFCSLLSDQVASLQDQLKQMRLDKTPEPDEPSSSAEDPSQPNHAQETGPQEGLYKTERGRSIEEHPQLKELKSQLIKEKEELKARYDQVFEQQKETLQKERQEHMSVLEKLQKSEQEIKRLSKEMDALDKRCEDLQFHNHTLLDDKKQLQESLDLMKGADGNDAGSGGGLERELRELQDSLHQKVMEHSEELRNKDKEMQKLSMMLEDTQYKYVIAHSKLSEIEKEHEQHMTDLKDKLEYKEIDSTSKQNEIEDLRQKVRQLQMDISGLRTKPSQAQLAFSRDIPQSAPPLMLPPNMQYVEAVKDGGQYTDPTVSRPAHSRCETTPKIETVNRGMELIARDFDEEPPTTSQSPQPPQPSQPHPGTQHPNSLSFRSQKPPLHHPSPSPSSASSSATPHQMPPHPVPGRRSPLSPHFTQAPPPRSVHPSHYPAPSSAATPYLSTPMGYPAMQPRHALPPQQQPHFDPNYPTQQGQYPYNQGARGPAPQPGSSIPPSARGARPSKDGGEPHDMPPPHGFHDPSNPPHHHQHHTQRRN